MAEKIILYGHETCPSLPPVVGMLKQSHIPYDYINIHQVAAGRARVQEINNGYESVPTLEFPDGSTLTEPSPGQLKVKLESLGYKVGPLALIYANGWRIFVAAAIIFAIVRALGII